MALSWILFSESWRVLINATCRQQSSKILIRSKIRRLTLTSESLKFLNIRFSTGKILQQLQRRFLRKLSGGQVIRFRRQLVPLPTRYKIVKHIRGVIERRASPTREKSVFNSRAVARVVLSQSFNEIQLAAIFKCTRRAAGPS